MISDYDLYICYTTSETYTFYEDWDKSVAAWFFSSGAACGGECGGGAVGPQCLCVGGGGADAIGGQLSSQLLESEVDGAIFYLTIHLSFRLDLSHPPPAAPPPLPPAPRIQTARRRRTRNPPVGGRRASANGGEPASPPAGGEVGSTGASDAGAAR